MNAGRDLDCEIARKVFGLNIGTHADGYGPAIIDEAQWTEGCPTCHCDAYIAPFDVPKYSTSIADAWEIIEKFKAEGNYKLEISAYPKDECWTIKAYHRDGYKKSCTTSAKTMAHAICLAALKAVGSKS